MVYITVAINGSKDSDEIQIDGLENYMYMYAAEESDSDDEYTDVEDPFADCTEDVSLLFL